MFNRRFIPPENLTTGSEARSSEACPRQRPRHPLFERRAADAVELPEHLEILLRRVQLVDAQLLRHHAELRSLVRARQARPNNRMTPVSRLRTSGYCID